MFVRTARRTFRPAGGKRAATHIGVTLINRSASTSGDSLDPERATGNVIWWNGGFDLDRDVPITGGCEVVKSILDDVGIDSVIRADTSSENYRAINGAELLVEREDVHEASEALHRRHRWPTM
jgi:hypothetical protein